MIPASTDGGAQFDLWLGDLERRYLADLRLSEVVRGLRALSWTYVKRRASVTTSAALDGRGKRAAFALFYGPLHFLITLNALRALAPQESAPSRIVDVGCGTGAAGAAWALMAGGQSVVRGIDKHPWALDEARRTYHTFGLRGAVQHRDLVHSPKLRPGDAVVAAYVLNELPTDSRERLEDHLFGLSTRGVHTLILEPVARGVAPWWTVSTRRAIEAGGRADEWRWPVILPPLLQQLDRAAGFDHRELTVRSIWVPGAA